MKEIAKKVLELIKKYGSSDPVDLCEKMGIIVHDHDLPEHINGFASSYENIPFMVLNSSLNYYNRKITAAHELGHIILHGATNSVNLSMNTSFCTSKYEREADCFAAHLLIAEEISQLEDMECVTVQDISMVTHMPLSMSLECEGWGENLTTLRDAFGI